ncbi:MAG: lysophospholipase [Acholeplasmataceae bacterium]|jgi:lysophospholipase L1-like esterase|nr:lysophospholipase [Acholeplasmataceae bacterium]
METHYNQRLKAFSFFNKYVKPEGIVFLGDSITEGFNVYEFFNGLNVYNRGISGDTTVGVLKRLEQSVFQLKPGIVVILIGTNDLALLTQSTKEVSERIKEIVKAIRAELKTVKIILQSIYPVNYSVNKASVNLRTNTLIKEINQQLKIIKDITYLDIYSLLIDETGNLNKNYTDDGLHINNLGYEFIAKQLKKYF